MAALGAEIVLGAMDLYLRVFDVDAHVITDSEALADVVGRMLGRFRMDPSLYSQAKCITAEVSSNDGPAGSSPRVVVDGQELIGPDRLLDEDGANAIGAAYGALLRVILARVSSHMLFHAGATAYREQGVIFVGDVGHGKTTLTLGLARRGFRCLSDEVVALRRADGLLCPFPRALHVDPESLRLAGWAGLASRAELWSSKQIIDITAVQGGALPHPVALEHVVLLQGNGVHLHPGRPQDFSGPARLRPLPSSLAVIGMLTHCQARDRGAVVRQELGSWAALYAELARLLARTQCYELSLGTLPEMADLVCGLVGA